MIYQLYLNILQRRSNISGIDVVMTDKKASDFIEMKLSSGIVSSNDGYSIILTSKKWKS